MTTTLRRAALATALTGALSLVAVATAGAATFYKPDAAGDVVSMSFPPDANQPPVTTPAPGRPVGDIVKIKSVHSAHEVAVKIWFNDLTKANDGNAGFLEVRTNTGRYRLAELDAGPGHWGGGVVVDDGNGGLTSRCATRHVIDYDANTVVLGISRTCLGNPRWVRMGFIGVTYADDVAYVDDARRTGYSGDDYTTPTLGGPTYRG